MGRPIRNSDPHLFRVITIRTAEGRLWITPTGKVRKLIGGILARYQELLSVEIYAYCVLGNHLHMLIRAPLGNVDEFCENVHREIARRLNWKHRRTGQFWSRRYDDQEILTDRDLIKAFVYIITNPTRHGLLENSQEWPGLNAYEHVLSEEDEQFTFVHHSKVVDKATTHRLKLSILPPFAGLDKEKRRKTIKRLLERRMKEIAKERRNNGLGFLGLEAILSQQPGSIPKNVASSPRPPCYTACPNLRKAFTEKLRLRMRHYAHASRIYRLGNQHVTFPPFSFKPPLHRKPRLLPFLPLPLNLLPAHQS